MATLAQFGERLFGVFRIDTNLQLSVSMAASERVGVVFIEIGFPDLAVKRLIINFEAIAEQYIIATIPGLFKMSAGD